MPSFDIVSTVDMHEITNAIDQSNREVQNRFDFKGSDSQYEWSDEKIVVTTASDFQLEQMKDILKTKLSKRNVDVRVLDEKDAPDLSNNRARQKVGVKQGIPADLAKKMVRLIKDKKMKVQANIQGDQIRVTGKKRDDLQEVIAMMREEKWELPLQFENFRD